MLLLTLCYAVIALLLITVVASASSVHLERKRLLAVADQTALAAADSLGDDAYYGRGPTAGADRSLVVLTDASVRTAVEEHLARSPGASRLTALTVLGTSTDGRTAEVTLGAVARPPLVSWVTAAWSDGIALRATSRARAD
nr:pilus assembly protein TadG-related protein [uncultured Actinotalea sp.]